MDYNFSDEIIAGLVLKGIEIKAIRAGKADLTGSHVKPLIDKKTKNLELWLIGAYIDGSNQRNIKLLVTRQQLKTLAGKFEQKKVSLIPKKTIFKGGYVKLVLGLGQRKNKQDKRQHLKDKDRKREAERSIKNFR